MRQFNRFLLSAAVLLSLAFGQFAQAQFAVGGLYASGASTGQALSTTAAKFTAFTTVLPSTSTDGDQSVVADAASDTVAVVAGGVYVVRFSVSATADATTLITYTLRDGSTAITGASTAVQHPASTRVSATMDFVYRPTATGSINVFAVAASGTPSVTAGDAQLVVLRIK